MAVVVYHLLVDSTLEELMSDLTHTGLIYILNMKVKGSVILQHF